MAKKATLKDSYKKELRRIKRFLSSAEKRGFIFPENVIPTQPKRITRQSVERLKKITPKTLYDKAQYVSSLTYGEVVSGKKGRILERQISAKKAAITRRSRKAPSRTQTVEPPQNISTDPGFYARVTLANFRVHVKQFNPHAAELLLRWLDEILAHHDANDVAEMLNKGAENGQIVNHKIVYSDKELYNYMSAMLNYLPEAGDLFKEELLDAMEEDMSII